VKAAKKAPEGAGNVRTWTALDADTKLICTWSVGARDAENALNIMEDLRARVKTRMQLTTDGLRVYLEAVQTSQGDYPHHAGFFVSGPFTNLRHTLPAGDLRGPATEIPTPPSDHIPLWWRCAFQWPVLNLRVAKETAPARGAAETAII
jgi:hypothetical protein